MSVYGKRCKLVSELVSEKTVWSLLSSDPLLIKGLFEAFWPSICKVVEQLVARLLCQLCQYLS